MKLAGFRQFSRDPEPEVINKIKQLHNTGYINSSLICCSQRWRLVGTVLWESSEPIFRINEKPFFWLLANWCLGGIWSNWSLFKLRVQNCKKTQGPSSIHLIIKKKTSYQLMYFSLYFIGLKTWTHSQLQQLRVNQLIMIKFKLVIAALIILSSSSFFVIHSCTPFWSLFGRM